MCNRKYIFKLAFKPLNGENKDISKTATKTYILN